MVLEEALDLSLDRIRNDDDDDDRMLPGVGGNCVPAYSW